MAPEEKRLLKAFLCHASGDKPPVRELYKRLVTEGVDAWLDKEKLLPGQDWQVEIPRAVHEADVVVVCLSNKSITKEGYVQKEIKFALDIAEEKPEGTIFLIPARLEDCPVPERLSRWQWVDLYEENGFTQLLRSLKLRADVVGARIEPVSYEDTEKEVEQRIKRLYTEGLAAFYTEDWDRACQRFQTILNEHPNHKNADEKLEEAKYQRQLARLYLKSTEAIRTENWDVAVQTLEELCARSTEYKDVRELLKNATKQKQLRELYAEAKTLHEAQKWDAVVKVFDQISRIDPDYIDMEGLLSSAQKESAELKRIAALNDLYSKAVDEMDAGKWSEARTLLEQVHKAQTGFLETEKLLRKVENEILKEEEKRRQNDQIDTFYEQAHGLLRSKKWRNALEKLEEIRRLDEHFPDPDGIAENVQKELELEEQEAEQQNKLAALYAESVKLLREEKYQEALDRWQEVKAIDPKYPDRQWVQRTARKKLTETAKPAQSKPRFVMTRPAWFGVGTLMVIAASLALFLSTKNASLLFFDDFNGQASNKNYIAIPENLVSSGYKGAPNHKFETVGESTLLDLRNSLKDGESVGWQTAAIFHPDANAIHLEVRFNTMVQSRTKSIDGFLSVGLFSEDNSEFVGAGLYAGGYGSDRTFQGKPFAFQDNTWYRLVITGSKNQEVIAALCDDESGKILIEDNMGLNPGLFKAGIKIRLMQSMGVPGGTYPTEVAIDWIRLSIIPTP